MSDTGRDDNLIPDDVQANYRAIKEARGLSWEGLAEEFDRNTAGLQAAAARSFELLAGWARAEHAAAPASGAGDAPQSATQGPRKRTAVQPPAPRRTAV